MTCSHNVVFLLDTADSTEKDHLHLGVLRILNFLGCKFGLAKVRWDFKFFNSMGIRGRASRVGSFRELGSRSWEDFEEELEARFGKQLCPPCSPGQTPRSTVTRNILKETLLDYQWDRPEIVSPTKPVLRSQKNKLTVIVDNPPAQSTHAGFANAILVLSPCPHSRRELWQFISGNYAPLPEELPPSHDLAEKFLPKGIQDMMVSHKVTLYWMDTTEWSKLLEPPDHIGYLTLLELMCILGGTIFPSEVLTQHLDHQKKRTIPASPVERSSSEPSFTPWTELLPLDSSLNCLFSSRSSLQTSFPNLDGVLLLKADGNEEARSCSVVLEPLTLNQRYFEGTVTIRLKCTMTDWKSAHVRNLHTESWTLRSKPLGPSTREISWFQHFVKYILAQGLHMVAEVTFSSGAHSPCTGVFFPISGTTALLSLLFAEQVAEAERSLLQTPVAENFSKEDDFCLPEVVSSVLRQVMEDSDEDHQPSPESLCPGWVQQELSCAQNWNPAVLEDWYGVSNLCGASSHLMESFRMLQASSTQNEEETPKSEAELRQSLAEFYQKKVSERTVSSHPRDQKKRCGIPRTPIRLKMKTMPRSLQMLNAAMFNVKAQKYQPDGELPAHKKPRQRLLSRRLDGKGEGNGRKRKSKTDFSTEDEMLSYVNANYQNAMMDGENLFARSQDMVTAVSTFQSSSEATCLDTIQRSLLKTTNTLRQQLATDPDKETRIKECRLQVYLRLEMCLQHPSLQNNTDRMEQLVQEMTDLLRMLCLTKDPGYLTSFLEEVVDIYLESMPKTLGDLYYSLGTEIPAKLAFILPTDFFSDDSTTEETQSVSLPASAASLPLSKAASLSAEADELEELRTRSAKKRKHPLARHRSITEMSQNLRQIEIPQASWNHRRKDTSHVPLDAKLAPISKKMGVQEVTKVRRNLFNEETLPLGKSSLPKMARSQSVSILEDLKHKRSRSKEDIRAHHKLLTKRVAETPLHKQMSKRLLQRQITGRCSDPGSDVGIVEESPEKNVTYGLRRSPRIKQLVQDKFLSSNIHSLEPNKRNTPQVHSTHLEEPGLASPPIKAPQSPKRILFGEVLGGFSSGRTSSPQTRRKQLNFDAPVPQAPGKSYFQSSQELLNPKGSTLRRSPRIQEKARRTPQKTPALKNSVAKCLGNLFSPPRQKSKSLPTSTENQESRLPWIAEKKNGYPSSPKAAEPQTPEKPPLSDMLDDVFALPADGPDSPIVLSPPPPSSPFALQEKSCSEPQSPRRSLRIGPQIMPTVSAENRTFEIRRNTCPEPVSSVDFPSLWPEASSAAFEDAHPEELGLTHIQSSLNVRAVFESASEIRSAFQFDGVSPSCNGSAKAVSPCTLSPTREKLGRNPCSPQETQSVRKTSPIKALGSPPSLPREEHPSMATRSLVAETSPFIKPGDTEEASLDQRPQPTTKIISPTKRKDLERCLSPTFSSNNPMRFAHAVVLCEKLDLNKSLSEGSRVEPGSWSSIFSAEDAAGGQPLLFSSPPRQDRHSPLAISKPGSGAYALRCTADRRQREAAARLEKEEKTAASKTLGATATPLTYEVELEMPASGLPKLRIRKVASEATQRPLDLCDKLKGEENDRAMGDVSVAWCSRHPEKLEPVSISPSCVRSAHNTPGKFGMGGQTYICHSYSPTLCTSSTTSPSQGSSGVPWTPSPKRKGKVTPEAIKDWPRRKRAAVGYSRSERPAEAVGEEPAPPPGGKEALELFGSRKVRLLGDPELEGIDKLQDQSLGSDTEGNKDENIYRNTLELESRKRAQKQRALGEEASQETKRPCLINENPGAAVYSTELLSMREQTVSSKSTILEDIFNFSDTTPPKSSGNGVISASGLWALEQSPLLYKGPPATQRKCPKGEDPDTFGAAYEDFSLFRSTLARKRSITRTYSRKRPLC